MNIAYFRVSKEEKTLQDLEPQKKALCEKYNLNKDNCLFIEERGSAYDINKLHKRKEFLKLLRILYNADNTTISDLFLGNYTKKAINLYVWDYHRIMRNFEFGLLIGLLNDFYSIKIYSHNQGEIRKAEQEKPLEKFFRYIRFSISAFSSEDYSYNISENIKKVVSKKEGITIGPKGKKWGRRFRNLDNQTIVMKKANIVKLNARIEQLRSYYKKQKIEFFYDLIIGKIRKEFRIKLSKAYISKLKNKKI